MQYKVVKVLIEYCNRKKLFLVNNIDIRVGDYVVVESSKGIDFGKVCSNIIIIDKKAKDETLQKIIRKATMDDIKTNKNNLIEADKALLKARNIASKLKLNMNILIAYFTFDRSQLVYNFVSEDRIDFRELAKKLAAIYKTRIELRQIGVRDKAKEVGGIGPCGRFLCCNLFLNEFDSVSINMAKNQYISLKPDKINGICGRLLCCLNYEDEQYTEEKRKYPPLGTIIEQDNKKMKVIGHNLFKNSFTVETADKILLELGLDQYESSK